MLRIFVSGDRADWSREVATAKRVTEFGATVFASLWNPPAHMVETFVHGQKTDAKRLRYDMYGAYAQRDRSARPFACSGSGASDHVSRRDRSAG